MSGATMPRLPLKALAELEVPLPSDGRLRWADDLVRRFDSALRATQRSLQELVELERIEFDLAVATVMDKTPEPRRR